jgi:hypothetical protein
VLLQRIGALLDLCRVLSTGLLIGVVLCLVDALLDLVRVLAEKLLSLLLQLADLPISSTRCAGRE